MLTSVARMADAYAYRAARADGSLERGVIELVDRPEAVASLRARGLTPVELTAMSTSVDRRSRLSAPDLAVGFRTLATLLSSGMPVNRALAAFEEVAPSAWNPGLAELRDRVRQGDSLGAALDRSVLGIPKLMTGIIRAGEAGSGLASASRRAADLAETAARFRESLRSAMAYPILLAAVGAASIAIIVLIVLPRFAAIIGDVGGDVPPLARAIMAAASVARAAAAAALVAGIGALILWRTWANDAAARTRIHATLLAAPVLGPVRLCAASSRSCAALSALLDAGVPVASALMHAARATGDAEVERRILSARDRVVAGDRLSTALVEARAVTSTAGRLIRAGEDSGQLPQMLDKAAEIDNDRVTETLRGFVRLIEPAMIIGFATIIALVSGALLQTVYSVKP